MPFETVRPAVIEKLKMSWVIEDFRRMTSRPSCFRIACCQSVDFLFLVPKPLLTTHNGRPSKWGVPLFEAPRTRMLTHKRTLLHYSFACQCGPKTRGRSTYAPWQSGTITVICKNQFAEGNLQVKLRTLWTDGKAEASGKSPGGEAKKWEDQRRESAKR